MAQPQVTLNPFSDSEKDNFREFELLLRNILVVAALPANQQANFLQLHLRDAAFRFFQTLPLATRQKLELPITALRDRFCNPQLQELRVLKLKNMKFDSKTDTPAFFWSHYKQKQQKLIWIQILQLLLHVIHMQQMLLLNKLGLTKTQRVAQKEYALLKNHVQFKLDVNLSKLCLDGYAQSCSSNPRILQ